MIQFNESDRFNPYYIFLSELIYGTGFQSPGGENLLDEIFNTYINDYVVDTALDAGFGSGGNSFYLSKKYNCKVEGIDNNESFVEIATGRSSQHHLKNILFVNKSILELDIHNQYDIAICRDVFMYINEKALALMNLYNSLNTNGKIVFIDYCKSDILSSEYKTYIEEKNYNINSLNEYEDLFQKSGFKNINIVDITEKYIKYADESLLSLKENLDQHSKKFERRDLDYLVERTLKKILFCKERSMVWGLIIAEK